MVRKLKTWAHKITVDTMLLVLCTVICFTGFGMVAVSIATYSANASDVSNEDAVTHTKISSDMESLDVLTSEMPVEETAEPTPTVEPEPVTIKTTRLGVIVDSYDPTVDYSELMAECAATARDSDDPDTYLALGEIYEAQRNLKIMELGESSGYEITDHFGADKTLKEILHIYFPPYMEYTMYEAQRLAMLINGEAGSWFVSDKHQRDVASVVINRVESDRFPSATSIVAAIEAPGQYPGTKDLRYYTDRDLANAIYVLENGPTTTGVFQANFKQGPVVAIYDYRDYGWEPLTYICE